MKAPPPASHEPLARKPKTTVFFAVDLTQINEKQLQRINAFAKLPRGKWDSLERLRTSSRRSARRTACAS